MQAVPDGHAMVIEASFSIVYVNGRYIQTM